MEKITITPEQVQGFINWQQEKPNTRKVEIKIGETSFTKIEVTPGVFANPNYRVTVSDDIHGFTCMFVNDVSEIDLIGQKKRDLQRQIERLQKLEELEVLENGSTSN